MCVFFFFFDCFFFVFFLFLFFFCFFFFVFFLFVCCCFFGGGVVYGPFKNISLMSNRSFIKGEQKPEHPGKNHLIIRKQSLAFPHVTQARLESQR